MNDLPDLDALESNLSAPAPKRAVKPPVGMPKTVRIQLENNEHIPPTGLPLGHNGRAFILRAGEPVNVPREVLGILEDAIVSTPIVNPSTMEITGYRDQMRYPFRILDAG